MTEQEIRKMNRSDLVETALDQMQEIDLLKKQNELMQKKLDAQQIDIQECGSIAEACLKLSGIFEDAQKASQMYVDNTRRVSENAKATASSYVQQQQEKADAILSRSKEESRKMLYDSKASADQLLKNAREEAQKVTAQAQQKSAQLLETTRQKCKLQETETSTKCDLMVQKAKKESGEYWENVRTQMEKIIAEHDDLKNLLSGFSSKIDSGSDS